MWPILIQVWGIIIYLFTNYHKLIILQQLQNIYEVLINEEKVFNLIINSLVQ